MPVTQLMSVSLTVADLEASAAFCRDALGLAVGRERAEGHCAAPGLLGLPQGTEARAVDVEVGRQRITLVAFDPPGQPYPPERASNDQWFQHVALVCGDMAKVWARLADTRPGTITADGPVLLPPNTGSVTAFKFRDPEGRPLELIAFPEGVGAPLWHPPAGPGICGFDHTAISVLDLERSLAFYTGLLGLRVAGTSLNQGPEQDRLDGLAGCTVDVVGLAPASVATPHLELLHYRAPRGRAEARPVAASDVASVRQVYRVEDLDGLVARLRAGGAVFVSPGIMTLDDGLKAVAIRDPDGHMIVLVE